MHIYWKGQSCFYIVASQKKGDPINIVIDGIDKDSGTKLSRQKADLCIYTQSDIDLKKAEEEVFSINGPGEYETREIYIKGIPSEDTRKDKNVIYTIEAEDEEIRICHMGMFNQKELTSRQIEEIGDVDILMIPVGGNSVIDGAVAASITNQIEPKIVIPMYYSVDGDKKLDTNAKFLKASGEASEPQDKLLIKRKEIDSIGDNTKVVVLKP